jgi:hypothetical protein
MSRHLAPGRRCRTGPAAWGRSYPGRFSYSARWARAARSQV